MQNEIKELFKLHLEEKTKALWKIMEEEQVDYLFVESGFADEYFLDDQTVFFRTNPHFLFFCPAEGEGHLLKIRPGEKLRLFFYSPDDFWHEPSRLKNEFWEDFFEIELIQNLDQLWKRAGQGEGSNKIISPQPERGLKNHCQIPEKNFLRKLHWLRASKTDYEVSCLREATRKASLGHISARRAFYNGDSEIEIFQEYLKGSKQRESELPYGGIIALDEKSAILHYQKMRSQRKGKNFLIDAGARVMGYCSDISRTWFVESVPQSFKDIHRSLEGLQKSLCKQVSVDLDYPELHRRACLGISKILIDLGLFRCSLETAMELNLSKTFFPHGLGHPLGIQVHDVAGEHGENGELLKAPEDYPRLRTLRKIQPMDVLTIEPGIYFIPFLLEKLRSDQKLKQLIHWELVGELTPLGGIRIEDNVVVKTSGPVNLTREFLP